MKHFRTWFATILATGKKEEDDSSRNAAARRATASAQGDGRNPASIEYRDRFGKKIIDSDASRKRPVRKKYLRENTATHETLKIIDESLLQNDDKDGIDPYNSGQFDRSQSWNSLHFRK